MNSKVQTPEPIEQMIRVNHAGEFGAQQIYAGQLAVLKGKESEPLIRHMAAQEKVHFDTFDTMLKDRRVRPTALMPIWRIAGFALGAGTALFGKQAAMACTVAVESVINEHYKAQYAILGDEEKTLKDTIETFRKEEMEHHDIGLEQGAEQAPLYETLTTLIKAGSKAAIWLSKRI